MRETTVGARVESVLAQRGERFGCRIRQVIGLLLLFACAHISLAEGGGRIVTENLTLTEDLTVDGTLTISNATVNLNGRKLTVRGLAGNGVIAARTLPAAYEELAYIESDTVGQQYIDTGVVPTPEAKIEADIAYLGETTKGTWTAVAAASNAGNEQNCGLWVWYVSATKNVWSVLYHKYNTNSGKQVIGNERCQVVASWKSGSQSITVNGGSGATAARKINATTPHALFLPAQNQNGKALPTPLRIYSVKLSKPVTKLVRDYHPARRLSDGAVGLYDTVNNTFSPSLQGAFTAGPAVGRGGGELHLDIVAGVMTNSTVLISNVVTLVKTGAGEYRSMKDQMRRRGGLVVKEGRVSSTLQYGFGYWGTPLAIERGGQVVINGVNWTLNGCHATIAGEGPDGNGAIYGNSGIGNGYNKTFITSLSLSDDALVKSTGMDAFNLCNNNDTLDVTLNGKTLTLSGTGRIIAWSVAVKDRGTLVADVSPGNNPGSNCLYPLAGGISAPLADFVVPAGRALGGEAPVVVSNLTFGGVWAPASAKAAVTVLGRYTPLPTMTAPPAMLLGDAGHLAPVVDLSRYETACSVGNITIAQGATVTVDVGPRTVSVGDCLMTWTAPPDISVSFGLVGEGWTAAERRIALSARSDGLYVKTTDNPAYAELTVGDGTWRFFLADGTPYPDTWTQGVTSDMKVYFDSYDEYVAIQEKGVSPAAFVMTGLSIPEGVTLVDMRSGINFFLGDDVVIDVAGCTLLLPAGIVGGTKPFTVTSSRPGGALVVEVADEGLLENTALSLTGALTLIKRGGGIFVSRLPQTYSGGTVVEAGTIRPPDPAYQNDLTFSGDSFTAFGTGTLRVSAGATFDLRANDGYRDAVVLDGGTLTSSGPYAMTTRAPAGSGFGALTADSFLTVPRGIVFGAQGGFTDLGGHTLTVSVVNKVNEDLHLRASPTNGTVVFVGGRILKVDGNLAMRSTTLELNLPLDLTAVIEVRDYISSYREPYMRGTGRLNVYGSFTPKTDKFFNCTLQDGAVLDLSQRSSVFATPCSLASDWGRSASVAFAETASITVNLDGRADLKALTLSESPYVMSWPQQALPGEGVTFTLDAATARRGYRLKKTPQGLLLSRAPGLIVVVH